ncbi:DNA-3-methyladenine glycosylase family protein [Undibacterium sp. TJN25]|uniref:DNA-3-methyladenine glycosylase family protein n=1 Tax=Undibacterium sp. TJN25 TaxID=3413056 RepID=UPI003BF09E51
MPKKDVPSASAHLAAIDADWAALVQRIGPCGLQTMPGREPYEALIRAIAHQQLHGKAAEAILGRFVAMYPDEAFPSPDSILETEPELLRACGFSFAKIASIRGIAEGTAAGVVPTRKASQKLDDEELIARLVSLRGVGRWTVEMLLIYTLERPDILPVDDFGVREGWRVLKSLPQQPKPKELAQIGLAWSPHRSAAAWYLWRAAEKVKPAIDQAD